MEINNEQVQQLSDNLMRELSSHIEPWVQKNWPETASGAIPLQATNVLLNAFINFAAVNCAVLARTVLSASKQDITSPEARQWLAESSIAQGKQFLQVFMANVTDEVPAQQPETKDE